MADLFDSGPAPAPRGQPAPTRRGSPHTSYRAADAIAPHASASEAEVERFAKAAGADGFIDEKMAAGLPDAGYSSYRTRRKSLSDRNIILDSGRREKNERGRDCIVWVHRKFYPGQAPPVLEEARSAHASEPEKAEARAMAAKLREYEGALFKEGRAMLARELGEAARIMALLAR